MCWHDGKYYSCSYNLYIIMSICHPGAVWEHWRFEQTHLSAEGDGGLPSPLPRSLWEIQDTASQVNKVCLLRRENMTINSLTQHLMYCKCSFKKQPKRTDSCCPPLLSKKLYTQVYIPVWRKAGIYQWRALCHHIWLTPRLNLLI